MLHVALTGNIAAGKSSVAALFEEWGAILLDADAIVRELQRPGTPVLEAIVARFGGGILTPAGELDRAALRRRIVADPAARLDLERLVHPAVQAERRRRLAAVDPASETIVLDAIPLLFEAANPAEFDAIVLVDAPAELRIERLIRDRGLSRGEAAALVELQQPAALKRPRADFIIENAGSRDALREHAWRVWRKLLSLARKPA